MLISPFLVCPRCCPRAALSSCKNVPFPRASDALAVDRPLRGSWPVKFEGQFKHRDESAVNAVFPAHWRDGRNAHFTGGYGLVGRTVYPDIWQTDNHRRKGGRIIVSDGTGATDAGARIRRCLKTSFEKL